MAAAASLGVEAAKALRQKAASFRDAVVGRRDKVAAVDRFYRDLQDYGWRVDALQARLEAETAAAEAESAEAGSPGGRRRLLQRSLEAIEAQRAVAAAAAEERASHYAVGTTGATGRLEAVAAGAAEKEEAVLHLHQLVEETFADIRNEAMEILEVPAGGLRGHCATLQRRRSFWEGQLEETFDAWQQTTGEMHAAGSKAILAWHAFRDACLALPICADSSPPLAAEACKAVADAVALVLSVDFWETVGLAGLYDSEASSEDGFGPATRGAALRRPVAWLRRYRGLALLGRALRGEASRRSGSLRAPPATLALHRQLLADSLAEELRAAPREPSTHRKAVLKFASAIGSLDLRSDGTSSAPAAELDQEANGPEGDGSGSNPEEDLKTPGRPDVKDPKLDDKRYQSISPWYWWLGNFL